MTLYVAIVDHDDKADHFVILACCGDHVVKSYNISVDKENEYEKSVCIL